MGIRERARELERYFAAHRGWVESLIAEYVGFQSPSDDPAACDALADRIEADLVALGGLPTRFESRPRPVAVRFGAAKPDLALVFHHDTVWPVGSFPQTRREGDRWFAPGIFDMKANLPLMMLALRYLGETDPGSLARVLVCSSPDEEVQGEVSREVLPELASGCRWALVFEPPTAAGAFKQRRKGVGRVTVTFRGRAAHAGNHYHRGKSALKAAARFLLAAESWPGSREGCTVNAGLLRGGSAANTRPAQAEMVLDTRFWSWDHWEEWLDFLRGYRDPDGVALDWRIKDPLPPMDADHGGWDRLRAICAELDLPFELGSAGGGSDGSRLARAGSWVFDGLGTAGAGEHAANEHILLTGLGDTFTRNGLLLMSLLKENLVESATGS